MKPKPRRLQMSISKTCLYLALGLLLGCTKEDDSHFKVGDNYSADIHIKYAEPLEITGRMSHSIDLDHDGQADVSFASWLDFGNIHGDLNLSLSTSSWEIASFDYQDSILLCNDPNQPLSAGVIYNRKSGFKCGASIDSLLQSGHFLYTPIKLTAGSSPDTISEWQEQVYFHYEISREGHLQEKIFVDYYPPGTTEHYVLLRKAGSRPPMYAWFKLRVAQVHLPRLEILEWAVRLG